MSYSFRQKRKANRKKERAKSKMPGVLPKEPESYNPSKIISQLARAEGMTYWDYLKKNHHKIGGPSVIRVKIAQVVEEQDRIKAAKREAKRRAVG